MSGIYTASRVRHAPLWLKARESGIPISSTWIDEAGEGETICITGLWRRCVDEAQSCIVLVLYREDEEQLKGAFIEAGVALGAGKLIFAVGFDGPDDLRTFSFLNHPLVIRCDALDTAFGLAVALIPKQHLPGASGD